jgi:hypothetical protein
LLEKICGHVQMARHGLALATLVAASLCLPWRAADAMPLGHDDMAAADSYAADAFDPFFANSADDWNLLLPADVFARADLPVDPAAIGLRQVARSLQEDAGLQQILSATEALRTPEPLSSGQRNGAPGATVLELSGGQDARAGFSSEAANNAARAPAQGAAAARQLALPGAGPAHADTGAEIAINDGETLRDALRNLVSMRRAGSGDGGGAERQADGLSGGGGDPAFGLGQAALESRLLGEALNSFIRRTDGSDFEPAFSLFGLGRFSFDVGGNGNIEITDYASGLSVAVRDPATPPAVQEEKIDVIGRIRAFLASPTGTLSTIVSTVLLIVWCMVRMATALRR